MLCINKNTKVLEGCGASTPSQIHSYVIYLELDMNFLETHSKDRERAGLVSLFLAKASLHRPFCYGCGFTLPVCGAYKFGREVILKDYLPTLFPACRLQQQVV